MNMKFHGELTAEEWLLFRTVHQAKDQYLWPACTALMRHALQSVRWIVFTKQTKVWFFTQKTFVSVVVTASMHARLALHNIRKRVTTVLVEKWISVHSVQVDRKTTCRNQSSKNTDETVLQKESFLFALKCVQPKLSWQVMVTKCQTSSVSVWY
jgi:hypothetical protein